MFQGCCTPGALQRASIHAHSHQPPCWCGRSCLPWAALLWGQREQEVLPGQGMGGKAHPEPKMHLVIPQPEAGLQRRPG